MRREKGIAARQEYLAATNQEDECAAYRVEELTRMRDFSEEAAVDLNQRFQELRQAQSAIGSICTTTALSEVGRLRAGLNAAKAQCHHEAVALRRAVSEHQRASHERNQAMVEVITADRRCMEVKEVLLQ